MAAAAPAAPAPGEVAQHGPPAGLAPARRRSHKTPKNLKSDTDPEQLGFLQPQVWTYMQEYGQETATEGSKVKCVTMTLEEATARWMVTLHNDNAPELRNFNHFMTALRKHFKDPLAN